MKINIKNHPQYFHGLLSGTVLLLAKILLFLSGNWFFRVNTTFSVISFLILLTGVLLAGSGERKKRLDFQYWAAWLSGLKTISIAIALSLIGDQLAYRTQPNLAQETHDFQVEALHTSMKQMAFMSSSMKERILSEAENADPRDLYSIAAYITSGILYIFLNALWLFIAAGYTRKRVQQTDLFEKDGE